MRPTHFTYQLFDGVSRFHVTAALRTEVGYPDGGEFWGVATVRVCLYGVDLR